MGAGRPPRQMSFVLARHHTSRCAERCSDTKRFAVTAKGGRAADQEAVAEPDLGTEVSGEVKFGFAFLFIVDRYGDYIK